MNKTLVTYLDAIDGHLREHLDEDGELRLDTAWHLDICAGALLDGSITPAVLDDDWPAWFVLASAFVAAYGSEELAALEANTTFLAAPDEGNHDPLTAADREYLEVLREHIDQYTAMRNVNE